ncbi:YnaM/YnfT family protein [Enterobacter asburiae]|uniref:YnaM/YnfT family protein n=1 Tax=Enterobacter asburiae TaxID=61645 RepID=UPI003D80E9BA
MSQMKTLTRKDYFMTSYIVVTTVAVVMGLITLSLIKVWISTSNNPDNLCPYRKPLKARPLPFLVNQ